MTNNSSMSNRFNSHDRVGQYSMPTLTHHIFEELEGRYGPPEQHWTLLNVEVDPRGPCIQFLDGRVREATILLSLRTEDSFSRTLHELAYGCVHLLSRTKPDRRSVLQEGAAVVFADDYVAEFGLHAQIASAPGQKAARCVCELLAAHQGAIYELRKVEPAFERMSFETFQCAGLSEVPISLQTVLLQPLSSYGEI